MRRGDGDEGERPKGGIPPDELEEEQEEFEDGEYWEEEIGRCRRRETIGQWALALGSRPSNEAIGW